MMNTTVRRTTAIIGLLTMLSAGAAGCGASADAEGAAFDDEAPRGADAGNIGGGGTGGVADTGSGESADTFVPEEEEFVVQEVAATDNFVFVPNSDEESSTVARIDGRDLSVVPVEVGLEPVAVRATDVPNVGSVAYVLTEGASAIGIIRAEKISKHKDPAEQVSLLSVPNEINALEMSPNGKYAIGYIDPDKPLPDGTGIASLQVASVVKLGEKPADDVAYQLSVSRQIQEIEFTDDGEQAFIVGRDGVNRLDLSAVEGDAFVPPLGIDLSSSTFPAQDREVEVSPSGDFLVVRSSDYAGVALYRPAPKGDEESAGELRRVPLPAAPTDIDLHVPQNEGASVIASVRQANSLARIDVDKVFDTTPQPQSGHAGSADAGPDAGSPPAYQPPEGVEMVDAAGATPGLADLAPDQSKLLYYTGRETVPNLGVLNLGDNSTESYPLRNQIRSVAIAPNSKTAVVVHEKQEGPPPSSAGPLKFFQHNHGLTIFDFETGYRRPVTLQGDPASIVMTQGAENTPLVYAMLRSPDDAKRGVMRIDLTSYRSDFLDLPRPPKQLGRVAGKIFVSQEATDGRITFIDVDSGEQQTVSGYELNAGID